MKIIYNQAQNAYNVHVRMNKNYCMTLVKKYLLKVFL